MATPVYPTENQRGESRGDDQEALTTNRDGKRA
jgi:hypothetical protein